MCYILQVVSEEAALLITYTVLALMGADTLARIFVDGPKNYFNPFVDVFNVLVGLRNRLL